MESDLGRPPPISTTAVKVSQFIPPVRDVPVEKVFVKQYIHKQHKESPSSTKVSLTTSPMGPETAIENKPEMVCGVRTKPQVRTGYASKTKATKLSASGSEVSPLSTPSPEARPKPSILDL